jgi:hypothetical protein
LEEKPNTNEKGQGQDMSSSEAKQPADQTSGQKNISPEENKETVPQPPPTPKPQTQDSKPSLPNPEPVMDVHHSHHTAHKKKWAEHLLEFFMLFLAVFLGFVAENIREHLVEKNREKQFIQSMIADMKSDIRQLDSLNDSRQLKQQMMDSILLLLDLPDPDLYGRELYYFARWMPRVLRIIPSDGTMQQLRSGNLRLITSRKAVDAILQYDQLVRFGNLALEDREEYLIQQFYPSLIKLFDPRVFEKMVDGMRIMKPSANPKLISRNKQDLDEFYSHVHFLKNVNSFSMEFGIKRRNAAQHVLDVLRQEYHLGNE